VKSDVRSDIDALNLNSLLMRIVCPLLRMRHPSSSRLNQTLLSDTNLSPQPAFNASPTSFEALTLLIPGTILGLLARLGIEHLDSYPNAAIFSLAWVQGLGCLAMGAALGQKVTLTKLVS
jgi:hypothetical protein